MEKIGSVRFFDPQMLFEGVLDLSLATSPEATCPASNLHAAEWHRSNACLESLNFRVPDSIDLGEV